MPAVRATRARAGEASPGRGPRMVSWRVRLRCSPRAARRGRAQRPEARLARRRFASVLEPALALMLAATAVFTARLLARPETGPAGWWLAGWVAAGAAGILVLLAPDLVWLHLASHPLGALFPWLLLGGAVVLGALRPPRWLLPVGLAFGLGRAALAGLGLEDAAYGAALLVEPAVATAAGLRVAGDVRARRATRAERWLGPSLFALAALGAVHLAALAWRATLPQDLVALWIIATPILLGIQMQGASEHGRRALRRAHDDLEARVAERTRALAEANRSLQERIARDTATQQALQRSEERYRSVSELSSDLSFAFRVYASGRVRTEWVTDALTRITGYTREEARGDRWLAMIHPEDVELARAQVLGALEGGSCVVENRILRRDGEVRWIRTYVDVARDASNGSLRVVGAARDVTERRREAEERAALEERMREAERLESLVMLAGGIAHDFNNLLTVILGNARLLRTGLPDDALARTRIAQIEAAAEHAAQLIGQMLAYAGRASLSIKPVDLSRVVEELSDLLFASVPPEARLETELMPRLVIEGDATQLAQVVLNLVRNAGEALEGRAGSVRVRTGRIQASAETLAEARGAPSLAPGPYVFLEVTDTGTGMDEATRQRVFEPFFSTKFSGRGLGLAAVLGLVTAHRGVITLASDPGHGTTFQVLFPPAGATPRN
jgi:PAS domain S-box-containing protein